MLKPTIRPTGVATQLSPLACEYHGTTEVNVEVQSLLYTATSRAKTKLCIYLPDNLPGVNRVLDLTKR